MQHPDYKIIITNIDMKKYLIILAFITMSCKGQNDHTNSAETLVPSTLTTPEFEYIKAEDQNGLLILFPCFPCNAQNTLSEFKITDISIKNGVSILAMNLNERLYLKPQEKQELAEQLTKIIREYSLPQMNIFFGGFSSGGNISLIISDYLVQNKSPIQPKGVFVVDSPVDLFGLYKTAEKNLELNFSESAVQESQWIKTMFDSEFGNPTI